MEPEFSSPTLMYGTCFSSPLDLLTWTAGSLPDRVATSSVSPSGTSFGRPASLSFSSPSAPAADTTSPRTGTNGSSRYAEHSHSTPAATAGQPRCRKAFPHRFGLQPDLRHAQPKAAARPFRQCQLTGVDPATGMPALCWAPC